LDLLDGTPILDIKPYIPSYDSPQEPEQKEEDTSATSEKLTQNASVINPGWTSLGSHQTLSVSFTESAMQQINQFSPDAVDSDFRLTYLKSPEEALHAIRDILSEDPRSIYRRNKCQDRLYFCIVDAMHVTSWFDETTNKCEVLRVMPYSIRKKAIDQQKDGKEDEAQD